MTRWNVQTGGGITDGSPRRETIDRFSSDAQLRTAQKKHRDHEGKDLSDFPKNVQAFLGLEGVQGSPE